MDHGNCRRLCLTTLTARVQTTTFDVNGLNDWSDGGATAGWGGDRNQPTLVSNAMNHTSTPPPAGYQSGSLVFDMVQGDPILRPNSDPA